MKRTLLSLVFISAFFGFSESKAQINNFVGTTTTVRSSISPIVRIKGAMGFVIKKNLIVTITTPQMENGTMPEEFISFDRNGAGMPSGLRRFDSVAKIAKIDRMHHLALLSVDTKDAKPITLASNPTSEWFYWYMATKAPRTPMDPFHGASMIYASTKSTFGDSFQSILGSPVFNVRGEAVGIAVKNCDTHVEWEACSVPEQKLRQLLAAR